MPATLGDSPVHPGGLVTIAYLKARLDEGSDHIGIFMPLVLDVSDRNIADGFMAADVQEALAARHGVAIPQQTVITLLKRSVHKSYLTRNGGRYFRKPGVQFGQGSLEASKASIEVGQLTLGQALLEHADRRG